jgi:uncharacterized protein with von Willebrand factor type A (vWA) domain
MGGLPEPEVDGDALLAASVRFGRALHAEGLAADLSGAIDFARALTLVEIGDREVVRAAGAAIFVRHADEIATYRRVFDRFWRVVGGTLEGPAPARRRQLGRSATATGEDTDGELSPGLAVRRVGYTAAERLRHRDFATLTPDELRDAERMIDELGPRLATRRVRRTEMATHSRMLAPRAMLRANLANGAEPIEWVWRRRRRHPRRLVVLADISGSMDRHARLLLRFTHALARTEAHVEAFVFGTQLTRISRELRERDPDRALALIAERARFGSGGTRIGEAFRTFNRHWARRVLPTSAVVIVLSDGWDHGKPALIAEETRRLARGCHRLIWLNPLAGSAEYRPLAAGMAAALPSVDHLLPAASVADLQGLGRLLTGLARDEGVARIAA